MTNEMIVCDTPETISAFQMLAWRGRLKIELAGMRFKGGSTFAFIKAKFGLKGNKESVLFQYENLLRGRGIIQ